MLKKMPAIAFKVGKPANSPTGYTDLETNLEDVNIELIPDAER